MSELRTVIVTGGSRGLGAAICRKLASIGHPVAVNYASNSAAAEDVVRAITTAGGRAQAFPADVSPRRTCDACSTMRRRRDLSAGWSATPASSAAAAGSMNSASRR